MSPEITSAMEPAFGSIGAARRSQSAAGSRDARSVPDVGHFTGYTTGFLLFRRFRWLAARFLAARTRDPHGFLLSVLSTVSAACQFHRG